MDAVDTIKILGSLLGNGALSKGSGGNVLGSILGSALGGAQNQQTQGGGMLGDVLGGLIGGNQRNTSGGGMADVLGGLLGGNQQTQRGGGLGDLLGGLAGGGQSGGGLGDLLGSLSAGRQQPQQGNGMGDLLGSILGGAQNNNQSSGMGGAGGLGGLLGGALTKYAQNQNADVPNHDHANCDHLPMGVNQAEAADQATLVIRAMINAAKSDGSIDEAEQEKVVGKLGDVTQAEADFVRNEFRQALDVNSFVRSIPRGMEQQIYAVSLMAIDLDNNKEAHYLDSLAKGLSIEPQLANQIHQQLGAPVIYS